MPEPLKPQNPTPIQPAVSKPPDQLTVRDHFALHAPPPGSWHRVKSIEDLIAWNYRWADLMMIERSKPVTQKEGA
jgi:hypothetical protein